MNRRAVPSLRALHWVALLLVALSFLTVAPSPVSAQSSGVIEAEAGVPDYDAWEPIATRAETLIGDPETTVARLDTLRRDLVEWREAFLARQSANASRIETVREQIAALGAAPADGESEAVDIAARRSDLNAQLETLTAPVRRAELAFGQADGIIRELDTTLRNRQASQILRLDPSPLNPANWPGASGFFSVLGEVVSREVAQNYASEAQRTAVRNKLPLIGILIVVGLILLIRSSRWVDRGTQLLRRRAHDAGAGLRVAAFVASLLSMLVPALGLMALLTALDQVGLDGVTGRKILRMAFVLVAVLLGARWLSRQIFPPRFPPSPILTVTPLQGREARLYSVALAFLVTLGSTLDLIADADPVSDALSPAVRSVLLFPVTLIAGLMLFRLGQMLLKGIQTPTDGEEEESSFRSGVAGRIMRFLARASIVFSVVGPVLAALGYATAGATLVSATFLTLSLLAVVAVLQRLTRDIYAMVLGDEAARNGLIPVLINFALAICALPFLALIWGARVSDLAEMWTVLSNGVQLGGNRISPTDFLTFIVVFALLYSMTRLFQSTLKTQILPKTRIDTGGRNALVAGTGYIGIFLAAVLAVTSAGIDLSSLAIVAGALSLGIGFGLQTIVSNFVSGIILLIERPISEGDWIEVGGTMGVVKDISVRSTRVETFDRTDVIVPNADLISGTVTNWTKGNLNGRLIVPVGVAYGTDTKLVETILREIAEAAPAVIIEPPPNVFFMGFGANSLDFEIRAILRDVNYILTTRSDINHEINRRFAEAGIEIPFAQRDLWLRNPDALKPAKPDDRDPGSASKPSRSDLSADDLDGDDY